MLELMQLCARVSMARTVLREVVPLHGAHRQLKALTHSRKQRVGQRMQPNCKLWPWV